MPYYVGNSGLIKNAKAFASKEVFGWRGALESIDTAAANSILKDSVDLHSLGLISRLKCV